MDVPTSKKQRRKKGKGLTLGEEQLSEQTPPAEAVPVVPITQMQTLDIAGQVNQLIYVIDLFLHTLQWMESLSCAGSPTRGSKWHLWCKTCAFSGTRWCSGHWAFKTWASKTWDSIWFFSGAATYTVTTADKKSKEKKGKNSTTCWAKYWAGCGDCFTVTKSSASSTSWIWNSG